MKKNNLFLKAKEKLYKSSLIYDHPNDFLIYYNQTDYIDLKPYLKEFIIVEEKLSAVDASIRPYRVEGFYPLVANLKNISNDSSNGIQKQLLSLLFNCDHYQQSFLGALYTMVCNEWMKTLPEYDVNVFCQPCATNETEHEFYVRNVADIVYNHMNVQQQEVQIMGHTHVQEQEQQIHPQHEDF